jgi:hypothetical protein
MKPNDAPDDARAPRELGSRENGMRVASWKPSSTLPDPHQRPGWAHRWVRTTIDNHPDEANVNAAFSEGWEPVKASDYPELSIRSDYSSRFKDAIEIGGLLLCRAPVETMKQRAEYYKDRTKNQMVSVNNQLDSNRDPRFGSMFSTVVRQTNVGKKWGPEEREERGPGSR